MMIANMATHDNSYKLFFSHAELIYRIDKLIL